MLSKISWLRAPFHFYLGLVFIFVVSVLLGFASLPSVFFSRREPAPAGSPHGQSAGALPLFQTWPQAARSHPPLDEPKPLPASTAFSNGPTDTYWLVRCSPTLTSSRNSLFSAFFCTDANSMQVVLPCPCPHVFWGFCKHLAT